MVRRASRIAGALVLLAAGGIYTNSIGEAATGDPVAPSGQVCFAVAGDPGDAAIVNLTPVLSTGRGDGQLISSDVKANPPVASNVNFSAGSVDPNVAVARIGVDGRVCFQNSVHSSVHLVADHLGTIDGESYTPAKPNGAPDRRIDTRGSSPVAPAGQVCFAVAGDPGDAAIVNLTPVLSTGRGDGQLISSDVKANPPVASNVNFSAGSVDPNVAVARIGVDGRVCFQNSVHSSVHLVADHLGTIDGESYTPAKPNGAPDRRIDTRNSSPVAPAGQVCFAVAGDPGDAAIVNLTPVLSTGRGDGQLISSDVKANPPVASNVNFSAGSVDPNVAVARIGVDGRVCFQNSVHSSVHLVADHLGTIDGESYTPAKPNGAPDRRIDTRTNYIAPPPVPPRVPILGAEDVQRRHLAVGIDSICAIDNAGGVWCWGANHKGQLGRDMAVEESSVPGRVGLPAPAVSVDVGGSVACALLDDGAVWCWGGNYGGKLGDQQLTNLSSPVRVRGIDAAVDLEVDNGPSSCVLTVYAEAVCWGRTPWVQHVGVAAPDHLVDLTSEAGHMCGKTASRRLYCVGYNNEFGLGTETGNGPHLAASGVDAAAAGAGFTCAVVSGSTQCWGANRGGQLGTGSTEPIKTATPQTVRVDGRMTSLAGGSGFGHACGVTGAREVWCWGDNSESQLGSGSTDETRQIGPVRVAGLTDARTVSVGWGSSCASTAVGEVWCWGTNRNGQLGSGAATVDESSHAARVDGVNVATNGGVAYSPTARPLDLLPLDESEYWPPIPDQTEIVAVYAVPEGGTADPQAPTRLAEHARTTIDQYRSQMAGRAPNFRSNESGVEVRTVHLDVAESRVANDPVWYLYLDAQVREQLEPAEQGAALVIYAELSAGLACGLEYGTGVVIPRQNCGDNAWLLMHEVTHLLGAVPSCAPHRDSSGHVTDSPEDVMALGAGGMILDVGKDDYFGHGRPDCPDIADSPLLAP